LLVAAVAATMMLSYRLLKVVTVDRSAGNVAAKNEGMKGKNAGGAVAVSVEVIALVATAFVASLVVVAVRLYWGGADCVGYDHDFVAWFIIMVVGRRLFDGWSSSCGGGGGGGGALATNDSIEGDSIEKSWLPNGCCGS
jgi:hypothetical protein